MLAIGGDVELTDTALSSTLRNGFIRKGYGTTIINGGRNNGNIVYEANGMNGNRMIINNAYIGNFTINGSYNFTGLFSINNTNVYGKINFDYPAGIYKISNCRIIGGITCSHKSGDKVDIDINHCYIDGDVKKIGESRFRLIDNLIVGKITLSGGNSYAINNIEVNSENNIDKIDTVTYIPSKRVMHDNKAPTYSRWKKGDIVYNTEPSAGGYLGWVCINGGSPGIWKGFGVIQA